MKIKRLEIIGFKSFVDKASLDFPPGVTAIVGPNGCGKSNVVDAIRWVMGEQSAKNLRGKHMEDIIFGGSETKKPLGMAEVSLIFSTDDGRVPAKYLSYSEIQVTRRLYRDGESEYYLNKTPCRLLDITELFMDTGVGAKAYSIIEQGRIGMILLSKPEDRRFLIEEAAGVTKFKARKQVALKKIEFTRQNLLRIGDIVAEIRRQLNSLQRQAKKAEKFRACREELKEIELLFAVRNYQTLDEERKRVTGVLADVNNRVATLSAELERGEIALEERRIALLEEEKSLTLSQEEIYRLKGDSQGCENRLEFQRKELLNLERHRTRFAEELASLERQLSEAENELKSLEERKGAFVSAAAGEEQTLQGRERELEEMVGAERRLAGQMEETRRGLFALLSQIAQFNNQHAGAAKRLEAMSERFERNRRETMNFREKQAEVFSRSGELEAVLKALADDKGRLIERLGTLKGREEELKAQLATHENDLMAKRDELSRKGSRLHSLQELEAQFAGYAQGVKALFLSDRFRGRFRGVVADAIETGEEYEAALEAVMGDRLQYVVGSGEDDVLAAVTHLKESAGGRCSFILRGMTPFAQGSVPDKAPRLLEKVTINESYLELVTPLLTNIHIAQDLRSAVDLARQYAHLTFVTPEGDLAYGGGVISGGSAEAVQQGLIHKKREIKELSLEAAALDTAVQQLEEGKERLKEGIAAVEEELRETRQRLHQTDIQLLNNEKDLQRAREECQSIEERIAIKAMEDDQLREERAALEQEMADSGKNRLASEERKNSLEREVEALQETLAVKRREIDEAREVVTAMKVKAAALKEKRESNLRAIKRVEELRKDLQGRIAGHQAELAKAEQERDRLVTAITKSEESLKTLLKKQVESEAAYNAVKERYETSAGGVQESEARLKGVRGAVEELRQSAGEMGLRLSELAMKLRHLESSLQDKYRVEIVSLLPQYSEIDYIEAEKLERQMELQKLVDEMGEVNLTAIEEYRELEERFNFLSEQKKDLEESLHALQKAIQRINRTTRKRFLETFQMVNAKFQEVFPRLFCGGQAELRLTNEEDLLETGIDIIVQPPGKKLQNVTLLSGGEKALTAVALIFSIFLVKPSPFCLLDEVDAPLDDANIGRFNEMVREMTTFSQFIMITHSKTTMAVADTLYGVTMEEPGISKLVSVRLN
ncbi:MAG: chromosome segregation [Geobacteraceae bacterium]|nr:MAG: chromosome segregation [Geobacteraceae bacterium]